MAPLVGVNRRWLIDGLAAPAPAAWWGCGRCSNWPGWTTSHGVRTGSVGFQLAPRINAVGRLGDPLMLVELLTTQDPERALELARCCESLNRQRLWPFAALAIEAEALALLEADGAAPPAFLLLAQNHWHHGVIGIVAARLVERFGLPVALLAGEGQGGCGPRCGRRRDLRSTRHSVPAPICWNGLAGILPLEVSPSKRPPSADCRNA